MLLGEGISEGLKGIEKEKHGNSIQIKSFFYLYPYSVPSILCIFLIIEEEVSETQAGSCWRAQVFKLRGIKSAVPVFEFFQPLLLLDRFIKKMGILYSDYLNAFELFHVFKFNFFLWTTFFSAIDKFVIWNSMMPNPIFELSTLNFFHLLNQTP